MDKKIRSNEQHGFEKSEKKQKTQEECDKLKMKIKEQIIKKGETGNFFVYIEYYSSIVTKSTCTD